MGIENSTHEPEAVTEEDFVKIYGDLPFPNEANLAVNIRKAAEIEEIKCSSNTDKRYDPLSRLQFLAGKVGADNLLPKHHWLLEEIEE